MGGVYDEVEIGDLDYVEEELMYYYPCPCGDKFFIGLEDLWDGEDIAGCPSCTLTIRVLFEEADLPPLPSDDEEDYEDEDETAAEPGDVGKVEARADGPGAATESVPRIDDKLGGPATHFEELSVAENVEEIEGSAKAKADGQ